MERYARLIYAIPRRYGLSSSDTEDIFQQVCLILLEKLSQVRSASSLVAWIGMTTRRACWKAMGRRDAADCQAADLWMEQQPARSAELDEILTEWEARQALRAALSTLDPRSRTVLERLYFSLSAPSYESLAREMGMPVGSIGPLRARSLKKLRRAMEAQASPRS